MSTLSNFQGLYPLSKTLRFELIPQGKTIEHIQTQGLLDQDVHRANSYLLVKKIIDEYHKSFIASCLNDFRLNDLDEYFLLYHLPRIEEAEKKKFKDIQAGLRKQIATKFVKDDKYNNLFTKELIKKDLKEFVQTEEDRKVIGEFENFTTYFTGFHENRKNMYSAEEISTAIAYRLIHQNLPRFIDNIKIFEKVLNTNIKEKFAVILADDNMGAILPISRVEDMFTLDYVNNTLTQRGIDIYNHLIGGYTSEDGTKIQGLNEYINLHNQISSKENRIGKLKPLYKMILSDRMTASFIPEQFACDTDVLVSVETLFQEINTSVFAEKSEGIISLVNILNEIADYDLNRIYIRNDLGLTDLSQKLFGDWSVIGSAIGKYFEHNFIRGSKESDEKYTERKGKYIKSFDSFSIGFLNNCLQLLGEPYNKTIQSYFQGMGRDDAEFATTPNYSDQILTNYKIISDLLNTPYPIDKDLSQDNDAIEKIKTFLDSMKQLQWFVKPLLGMGNEPDKDEKFYGEFSNHWSILDQVTPLYNKVRNYITRKPYSQEKVKLNFQNSTLLDGWDVNKEPDNTSVILRKNGLYYLGIMNKNHNKIFHKNFIISDNYSYEKMEYKLLPGANKMLPKVFFSQSRIKEFNPSKKLLENYKNETHKKGDNFNRKDCHALIDFFKESIAQHPDWKEFGFRFSDTKTYEDLSGFYREVEQQGYKISFRNIPENEVDQMVEDGKLFLFQIYNKDFSPYSKGTPNMHTLYWKMLFNPDNLNNVVYKLNGQAEVFFRKSSIKSDNKIVHLAEKLLQNKNSLNEKKHSKFGYDIIKDKRYTMDKFLFHVPITMNFKSIAPNNINILVNQYIQRNPDTHVIGIDRGERHLLYLTMIDSAGKIIKQLSLNEIVNNYSGQIYRTDYHGLLDKKEGGRNEARQNWKTIENIKELKEGYLSQVIHQISEMMVQYNAIVVLEDLNMGFMRGRQKVEKQVYQKFEKMLIDKLNFLVDKKKTPTHDGGLLKAFQLTNKFESFQKMGKQSGFLFYVPAWNTSKMDPTTGFVNLFDTRYQNLEKAKKFFADFDSIRYNEAMDYFEFSFDYNHFTNKALETKVNWVVCSFKDRIETFRNTAKNNQWDCRVIKVTDEIKVLMDNNSVDFKSGDNIKEKIISLNDKSFYQRLLYLFKLTLQMRNSITGTDIDFLISPVHDSNGNFFDSRIATSILPQNADANGAYNIARKGLWIIEQIKKSNDLKKLKLAISNKEWLQFAQVNS